MRYEDLVSDPPKKRKTEKKICPACGEKFLPIDYRGVTSTRSYCTRPECEEAREREKRERIKLARRAKRVAANG